MSWHRTGYNRHEIHTPANPDTTLKERKTEDKRNIYTSGTLHYATRGRYSGRKRKKGTNIPRNCGHTTGTRNNSNEAIYPPTYSSTAERSTTRTMRSTHPCITAVQQMTYTAVVEVERAVKPWVQKTKVRNTSNTQTHEHTLPSTYSPTNRPHQPTHRPKNLSLIHI